MTAEEVRSEIDKLAYSLLEEAAALDLNSAVIRRNDTRCRVTWAEGDKNITFKELSSGTASEYITLLENRSFSVVLHDASLLQVSYELERDEVIGHRLAYYPCPFILDPEEIAYFGIIDTINSATATEMLDKILLRSPLRFDYAPAQAKEDHPESHLHLIHEECRIPVYSALSIGHFVEFLFRNFYPDLWLRHDFIREWPKQEFGRRIQEGHRTRLYLDHIANF